MNECLCLFLCLFLSLARACRRCRGSVLRRARRASPQIRAVACGAAHSLAVDAEGGVWAWGDNSRGQVRPPTRERLSAHSGTRSNGRAALPRGSRASPLPSPLPPY